MRNNCYNSTIPTETMIFEQGDAVTGHYMRDDTMGFVWRILCSLNVSSQHCISLDRCLDLFSSSIWHEACGTLFVGS